MKIPTTEYVYKVFSLLKKHYPDAKMLLKWENNFELLVAIILSAQCTDKKVNDVTSKLFPKFRDLKLKSKNIKQKSEDIKISPEMQEIINFAEIPLQELEQDIKSTGFYHNKAKNIKAAAQYVLEKYKGSIPKTIKELIAIPGVGRKTANVFLGNAYRIVEGIAVDTHVTKQSQLLGFTKNSNPEKIEQDLMKLFDKKDWFKLTYLLIEHGRNVRKKKSDRIVCNDNNCIICLDK